MNSAKAFVSRPRFARSGYFINIVLQSSYMSFAGRDNNVYGEILRDPSAASDALKFDS